MRDLVKEAGLNPIKFEFSGFASLIFYRKPLSAEKFISEDKNFGVNFGVKGKKRDNLLKLLVSIDNREFSPAYFANKEGVALRTIENYLKFLKDNDLIYFEGAPKTGHYKVTKKYKKLKKSIEK